MRTNLKSSYPQARTHEGAPSASITPTQALERSVMACMLFEDTFYESGEDSATRIRKLCAQVPFADLKRIAIDAREKMKLRHVPLLLAVEALRHHRGAQVGELIYQVIQRPDEAGELLALYKKYNPGKGEAWQLKVGIARALKKFSEYQLAKYKGGPEDEFRLRDALFISHARPKGVHKGDKPYTRKERKGEAADHRELSEGERLFQKLAEDELATPDTWEVALSGGADKAKTFTRLIEENKLGALAFLRNLRNMTQAGVSEDLIRAGLLRMNVERVLPFRFITAAKYAPRLEDALEQAMFKCLAEAPRLAGKTALMVDHSQSMEATVSAKSEITRFQAAAALAMILRETGEQVRMYTFSSRLIAMAPRRGFGLLAELNRVRQPESTMLGSAVRGVYADFPECDRIIVVTDEQSADKPPHPQGRGYIVNVAGYQNGIGYGPWVTINGWSEAILDYIRAYEATALPAVA